MYISPVNIIKGLIQIVEANREQIDGLLKYYRDTDTLNVFVGLRKTLPVSAYPSLELDLASASTDWTHTTAQTGEYEINCYLTVVNNNEELAVEYVSEVTRMIVKLFNWPENMSFPIPNEFYPDGNQIHVQFGSVSNVTYRSTRDGSITVAEFQWRGRVLEYFEYLGADGPAKMDWKTDAYPTD